jgi:hypothetical protein
MKNLVTGIVLFICASAIGCAAFGWVNNIVHICKADFESPYKNEIFRCVGIPIPPLGVVLGWVTFDEEE